MAAGGPFDDDAFGAGLDARRLGGAVDFEAGDAGELAFFAAVIAGVGGGEDEDVAVVLVAGMEGEGGDAAAHIEDEVFFSGGVGGVEGVEAAFVFGDPEAGGEGVLGDEDGFFKRDLGEGAGEAEGRGRVGGAGEAGGGPGDALGEAVGGAGAWARARRGRIRRGGWRRGMRRMARGRVRLRSSVSVFSCFRVCIDFDVP